MKKIRVYHLGAVFMAAFFIFYCFGLFLALTGPYGQKVIFSDNLIFFSYQRPFLYALVFAAEGTTGLGGTILAWWLLGILIKKKSLFLVAGILLFFSGIGFEVLAFQGNTSNETGHTLTFSLLGLFMFALSFMLFIAHKKGQKTH